jgi:hypothetical protein
MLPATEFYKDKSRADGRAPLCKQCQRNYKTSAAGKVVVARAKSKYHKTAKGKATLRRFRLSSKGQVMETEHGVRYRAKPENKLAIAERGRVYRTSAVGKLKRKRQHFLDNLKKYNLTELEFNALLKAQDNKCAICHRSFDDSHRPHVDHDHQTGAVRGLLCRRHNTGLGCFGDDADLMTAAIAYLRSSLNLDLSRHGSQTGSDSLVGKKGGRALHSSARKTAV